MKAYKKRLKGNWRQGKRYKGDGEERQYAKAEIKQELAAAEEDYLEKHHKGARTKNMKARLEYRVKWYDAALARENGPDQNWWMNYLRSARQKAVKALNKYMREKRCAKD